MLRQIEVSIGSGKTTPQACNEAGITVQTFYRWRKEYGGLKLEQAKRMKDEGTREGEYPAEAVSGRAIAGEASVEGRGLGKLLSPKRRRWAVERARQEYGMTERHACRLLGRWRGTQRYEPIQRNDEDALTRAIITLASKYGRYGYRRLVGVQ